MTIDFATARSSELTAAQLDEAFEVHELMPCPYGDHFTGNPEGCYECQCDAGEDLDRTLGFGELAHVW